MKRTLAALSLLLGAGCAAGVTAQNSTTEKIVARIGDETISRTELERAAAGELVDLKLKQQEVLEQQLERLVADRVLAREAEARGVDVAAVLQAEVHEQVADPTAEEVEAFFEENKARLPAGMTREQALPQIRQFLTQQARQQRYTALVESLREKYAVTTSLAPLRFEVETQGHPAKGPADATVTIVEFSDFECPYCSQMTKTLDDVLSRYGGRLRLVFRQFPLTSIHPSAMQAAEASLCAAEQDKFWELHDAMFEDQQLRREALESKARAAGLDLAAFGECLDSGRYRERVEQDLEDGGAVGVTGTPALFVNGRPLRGAVSAAQLEEIIEDELRTQSRETVNTSNPR